ncbi:hypothetical protein IWQ60_005177 [Tieghemiomyces parasiticus]|uniref:protein disulfide-isomerase n=1 Tax=Tieghemiomyces parasiticus TaxID=78921 RepID=A0A9W8A6S7_9FUNG|nr:hypothetical protein IWQ60_005177 [Tieghemiomyces parasiticus]
MHFAPATSPGALALLLLLGLADPARAGLYGGKSKVIDVTAKNFRKEIIKTEFPVMVEFYAPWCGHCQRLAPDFNKVAKAVQGIAKVAAIDCDEEANKALCAAYEIKGFPTLKLFPWQSYPDKKNPKRRNKLPLEYQGGRSAKEIEAYLLRQVPAHIIRVQTQRHASPPPALGTAPAKVTGKVTPLGLADFMRHEPTKPKVILFNDKDRPAPLYKGLAIPFRHYLSLGWVSKADSKADKASLAKEFGVTKYPTLIVVPDGRRPSDRVVYDGAINLDALKAFLKQYITPRTIPEISEPNEAVADVDKPADVDGTVPEIRTQSDLDTHCLIPVADKGACLVAILPYDDSDDEDTKRHSHRLTLLAAVARNLGTGSTETPPVPVVWINGATSTASALRYDCRLPALSPNSSDEAEGEAPASRHPLQLVALDPHRKAYRVYGGTFSTEAVADFVKEVATAAGTDSADDHRHPEEFEMDFSPTVVAARKTIKKQAGPVEHDEL